MKIPPHAIRSPEPSDPPMVSITLEASELVSVIYSLSVNDPDLSVRLLRALALIDYEAAARLRIRFGFPVEKPVEVVPE